MSEALLKAMAAKNPKAIRAAIEAGADMNLTEPDDAYTPLAVLCKSKTGAMSKAETETALWLIERGADVDKPSDFGQTPLHLAAASGGRELVDALSKKGAKVTKTRLGLTPLHCAVGTRSKDVELWERLITIGCGIDDRTTSDDTPLLTAASVGNLAAVKFLLSRGADKTVKNSRGHTALDDARTYGDAKIVKLLEA